MRFLRLIRYPNLLIMAATQCMAAVFLSEVGANVLQSWPFILAVIATLLIGAGGYIINDIFDMEADSVNKPGKLFITPKNKTLYAQVYYGLTAAGVLLGLFAGVFAGLLCIANAVLLFYYSYRFKKMVLWGNISIALMSGAVLIIVGFVVPTVSWLYLVIYAIFAFTTTLVREIAKDIEDVEGDTAAGYHTLPIVKGSKQAQKIAFLITAMLVLFEVGFALWCLIHLKLWAFYYLVLLVLLPTIGLMLLLYWANEKKHFTQASLICKLIMVAGLLSTYFIF